MYDFDHIALYYFIRAQHADDAGNRRLMLIYSRYNAMATPPA
jgi:hypothetical protein